SPESIAMQVVNSLFYGLPLDDLQNFRERVNAVTPDDIQRVAKLYLRPDRLSVVLVGNAKAFASQLGAVGFGAFETVDLPDLDLTSVNFKRSGTRAAAGIGQAVRARLARSAASPPPPLVDGSASSGGPVRSAVGAKAGQPPAPARSAYQQAPIASRPSDEPSAGEKAKAM